MAYEVLLRRPIDDAGLRSWRERIAAGRFDQQAVIDTLLGSDEYLTRFGLDLVGIVHRARQAWVRTVPSFPRLLDIGGSCPTRPEGALIDLGYPHRPARLDILDLPPDQQYWGKPVFDQSRPHVFDWGEVHYFHGRAERIGDTPALQDSRYDGIFLGQAIEHVYPQSLPGLLEWIKTHLAPGGTLVFDTPNRLLTKIQCPGSLIDPDHKHEYEPSEMRRIVEQAGFAVMRTVGMVHLPQQAASGIYDPREFAQAAALSDDVDACYLFALEAQAC